MWASCKEKGEATPFETEAKELAGIAAAKKKKKAEGEGGEEGKKPKRKPSSYINFCQKHRAKVKEEVKSFGEVSKRLAEMWRGLSDEEKGTYKE